MVGAAGARAKAPETGQEPSSLSKRERGKLEKRARIEQAAREVFAEKGFAAATTQEISARAGVAAGTLFLYARNKEELLVLAFTSDLHRAIDDAERTLPRAGSTLESVLHVFGNLAALHERIGPALSSVLLTVLMARGGVDISPERPRRMGLVEELLADACRARALTPALSPVAATDTLLSIFHWLLSHWGYERMTMDELHERMRVRFSVFLDGYLGPARG